MSPFTPLTIGSLKLCNRLVMAPVKTGYATADGEVTLRLIDYYARRAQGGVGAIIVEPCYIDQVGKEHPEQLGISEDRHITGLCDLVDAIHAEGAKVIIHLNHAGRAANPKASGSVPEAPSAVQCAASGVEPEVMTHARIQEVIGEYARAAERAFEAGFDAIEVQCGLGYLVAQFLSPRTNLREDEFGCQDEERLGIRFLGDILAGVRCSVGKGYPVIARISATEQVVGGLTFNDSLELVPVLRDVGVVAIHVVSGSACDSPPWYYQHMQLPPDANLKWATKIQRGIELPVIVAGRMGNPALIREAIGQKLVSAVALGRPLVADPDLPNKMKAGDDDAVIECGACLQGCLSRVKSGQGLGCIVNPLVGREKQDTTPHPANPKRIVIIGGGPAGMMAALTAIRAGHEVILFEKDDLGGQFALAPLAPGKEFMGRPLESLIRNVRNSRVDLRIGREAVISDIVDVDPDVVLVAAGAEPIIPEIAGAKEIVSGNDILSGAVKAGRNVLIVGGGLVGIECAEFLLEQGRQVTIVEMLEEVARDMEMITKRLTVSRLEKSDVIIYTDTVLDRIENTGEAITRTGDSEKVLGHFDTIVAAVGTRPVNHLVDELIQTGLVVKVIGDAGTPGQIIGATESAFEAVRSLCTIKKMVTVRPK